MRENKELEFEKYERTIQRRIINSALIFFCSALVVLFIHRWLYFEIKLIGLILFLSSIWLFYKYYSGYKNVRQGHFGFVYSSRFGVLKQIYTADDLIWTFKLPNWLRHSILGFLNIELIQVERRFSIEFEKISFSTKARIVILGQVIDPVKFHYENATLLKQVIIPSIVSSSWDSNCPNNEHIQFNLGELIEKVESKLNSELLEKYNYVKITNVLVPELEVKPGSESLN